MLIPYGAVLAGMALCLLQTSRKELSWKYSVNVMFPTWDNFHIILAWRYVSYRQAEKNWAGSTVWMPCFLHETISILFWHGVMFATDKQKRSGLEVCMSCFLHETISILFWPGVMFATDKQKRIWAGSVNVMFPTWDNFHIILAWRYVSYRQAEKNWAGSTVWMPCFLHETISILFWHGVMFATDKQKRSGLEVCMSCFLHETISILFWPGVMFATDKQKRIWAGSVNVMFPAWDNFHNISIVSNFG